MLCIFDWRRATASNPAVVDSNSFLFSLLKRSRSIIWLVAPSRVFEKKDVNFDQESMAGTVDLAIVLNLSGMRNMAMSM